MLLGLLIHAVYFMNITETYHPSPSLEVFSNFFKLFRMECFFILSGFLSAMLITRKGKEYLIDNRIKRVVIPLLSSLIVASALINYFYEPVVFFNGSIGYHIQHLWFLITLAILSFISISNVFNNFHNYSLSFFKKIVFLFVLYLFFRFLELSLRGVVSKHLFDIYVFFILKTTYFFIFYYIGFVFYRNEYILDLLRK